MGWWGGRREQGEQGKRGPQTIFLTISTSTSPPPHPSPILLIGLPGSGKLSGTTTVSRRSTAAADSTDAIRSQLFEMRRFRDRGWFMEVQRHFQQAVVQIRAQQHGKRFTMPRMPATTPARSHCTCPCHWLYPLLGCG